MVCVELLSLRIEAAILVCKLLLLELMLGIFLQLVHEALQLLPNLQHLHYKCWILYSLFCGMADLGVLCDTLLLDLPPSHLLDNKHLLKMYQLTFLLLSCLWKRNN